MIYYEDKYIKIYNGDSLKVLKSLPDESVNCCVTSPPYWEQRDYEVNGQIGLEKELLEYVDKLIEIFHEVKRILKDNGTLWLVTGDSYNGSGGAGYQFGDPKKPKIKHFKNPNQNYKGLKPKDLCGIPWRTAFALQADGWWLRQDIIWHKPNSKPDPVKDRCTTAHEYIFLLSKSRKYYYNYEAILEPYTKPMNRWGGNNLVAKNKSVWDSKTGQKTYRNRDMCPNKAGRNKRSVWSVNTMPFSGVHPAVFPEKLIEPCILAGCPEGGIVLDPFVGSGTVLRVAKRFNRKSIGIDLNKDYCEMAKIRYRSVTKNIFD